MTRLRHLITGVLATALVVIGVAWLSANPSVRVLPRDTAVVKVSFSHGGQRSCRERSAEEMAALPQNMRRTEICERKRQPVYLELDIDGRTVFARSLPPSGIAGDGASRVYERFILPAGRHDISIRLRDKPGDVAFDYAAERTVTLVPAQNYTIDFRAGTFLFN